MIRRWARTYLPKIKNFATFLVLSFPTYGVLLMPGELMKSGLILKCYYRYLQRNDQKSCIY